MKFFALVGRRPSSSYCFFAGFARCENGEADEEGRDELSDYFMHWCL